MGVQVPLTAPSIAPLCNGSTTDFDSVRPGSNPGGVARILFEAEFILNHVTGAAFGRHRGVRLPLGTCMNKINLAFFIFLLKSIYNLHYIYYNNIKSSNNIKKGDN